MAHYRTTVITPMSADEAFELMADMRTFGAWDPGIKAVEQVDGEGGGLGAGFDVTLTGMTLRYVTTEYRPPREVLLVADGSLLVSEDRITIDGREDGCAVTYDADLRLKGVLRPADPLLGVAFRRIGDRAAAGLRDHLGGSFADA